MLGFLVLALFSSNVVMKGIDDNIPVRVSSNTGWLIAVYIVGIVGLSLFITDIAKESLVTAWVKAKRKIVRAKEASTVI